MTLICVKVKMFLLKFPVQNFMIKTIFWTFSFDKILYFINDKSIYLLFKTAVSTILLALAKWYFASAICLRRYINIKFPLVSPIKKDFHTQLFKSFEHKSQIILPKSTHSPSCAQCHISPYFLPFQPHKHSAYSAS